MKQVITKNNFSAGELSPTLYTRTDIQQYGNGAKTLKNVIPLVEGGVRKRPGTLFLSEQVGAVRLIPFVVNSDNAFLIVFKPNLVEIVNPKTLEVLESIVSPYTESQIHDIQFVQYRYEMYLTHSEVPVHRLLCDTAFDNWQLNQFVYTHLPTDSENARFPFRKGKPSGKDIGALVSFTLSSYNNWVSTQAYLAADVVIYAGNYYQALRDNTDKQPNESELDWAQVWDVMRLADPVVDRKGNQLMSARSIYEIPDEKLLAFGDPQRVRDEVASSFQAHLLDEQGMAVVEAGLRERTFMSAGQKKGTAMGEITKSMLQFKSFPAAFLMRHGSRAMSFEKGTSKAAYGGLLIAMTTLLGGLVVQLKELANGNDPAEMWDGEKWYTLGADSDFLKRSFVAGGGL